MSLATVLHPKRARVPRSSAVIREWRRKRNAWLGKLRPECVFYPLFDHIPDVSFFAKDAEGRAMFVSHAILERYGMTRESEMVGLTDYDINPGSMAGSYVEGDRKLLEGSTQRIERIELWFDQQGMPDWFVVTKLPLLDRRGKPIGVMGLLRRPSEGGRPLPVFQTVARAVELIRANYASPLLIADIARDCGQSTRQLQRRFRAAFGITPQEFLLKTRVVAAARLLQESSLSLGEIASCCGFVDQSVFSRQFRERTGSTPIDYRRASTLPMLQPPKNQRGR